MSSNDTITFPLLRLLHLRLQDRLLLFTQQPLLRPSLHRPQPALAFGFRSATSSGCVNVWDSEGRWGEEGDVNNKNKVSKVRNYNVCIWVRTMMVLLMIQFAGYGYRIEGAIRWDGVHKSESCETEHRRRDEGQSRRVRIRSGGFGYTPFRRFVRINSGVIVIVRAVDGIGNSSRSR